MLPCVFLKPCLVGLHTRLALLPVYRADLAVLFVKLYGVDDPQDLVDVPAEREVVYGYMPQMALPVDYEKPAERDPGLLNKDPVLPANGLVEVGNKRVRNLSYAALFPGRIPPRDMGKMAVY